MLSFPWLFPSPTFSNRASSQVMLPQLTYGERERERVNVFYKKEKQHWFPSPFPWKLSTPAMVGSNYDTQRVSICTLTLMALMWSQELWFPGPILLDNNVSKQSSWVLPRNLYTITHMWKPLSSGIELNLWARWQPHHPGLLTKVWNFLETC